MKSDIDSNSPININRLRLPPITVDPPTPVSCHSKAIEKEVEVLDSFLGLQLDKKNSSSLSKESVSNSSRGCESYYDEELYCKDEDDSTA